MKYMIINIQGTQETSSKRSWKGPTPRHSKIEHLKDKDKERILKPTRGKWIITYKGISIALWTDFSSETAGQKAVVWYIQSVKRKKKDKQE